MVSVKMRLFKALFGKKFKKNKNQQQSLQTKNINKNETPDFSNVEDVSDANRNYEPIDSFQKSKATKKQQIVRPQNEKLNQKHIRGIQRKTLEKIIELGKKNHPKEFGAILFSIPEKGLEDEINEIREIKLGTKTQVKIKAPMVDQVEFIWGNNTISGRDLLNYSGVGIVHSHPNGIISPSVKDLELYSKFGNTNIIIAHPYDTTSWSAFDQNGKEKYIDIVNNKEKKSFDSKLIDLTPLNIILKKRYNWINTPIKFSELSCIKIKKEYLNELGRKTKIKSNDGKYVYHEEIAKEYYISKGYNVITSEHLLDIYNEIGIGKKNITDEMGYNERATVDYLDKKASKTSTYTYLPLSELQIKLAELKTDDIFYKYKKNTDEIQAYYDKYDFLFGNSFLEWRKSSKIKWKNIRKETKIFINEYINKNPKCIEQLIYIFMYLTYNNSFISNDDIKIPSSRLPQIIIYDINTLKIKFCKIYTDYVASHRKQLLKEDRLFYCWNKEFGLFDYEVLMILKSEDKKSEMDSNVNKNKDSITSQNIHKLNTLLKQEEDFESFDKTSKIVLNSTRELINKGIELSDLNRNKEAIDFYDRALELNPKLIEAWYRKGNALFFLKIYERAIECFDKTIELEPNYTNAWGNKGVALAQLKKYEESIECYDKVIELEPKLAEAWYKKGIVLNDIKKYWKAIDCFNKAIGLDQKDTNAWCDKGNALSNLNRHEEAIDCFNKAIELKPKLTVAWYNKGVTLIDLNQHEEAIECFNKAIELDPKYANAWNNNGAALAYIKRHKEAIECFNKAIDLDPKDSSAWDNKGVTLAYLKKYEEAIECYDKAIELNPKLAKVWSNKGIALDNLERHEESIECYDKVIQIDPKFLGGWNNKGVALGLLKRFEDAIYCFDKTIELDHKYFDGWNYKGYALIILKRYQEAIVCYNRAIELEPKNAGAYFNIACSYSLLNDIEKSFEFLKKAIDMDINYKEVAKTENDFNNIRNDERFRKLVYN